MSTLKNIVAYGVSFAIGLGTGYHFFNDPTYGVVKANCRLYVQEKATGRYGQVDTDFDIDPKYLKEVYSGDCSQRSLADLLEDAFRRFMR